MSDHESDARFMRAVWAFFGTAAAHALCSVVHVPSGAVHRGLAAAKLRAGRRLEREAADFEREARP